MSGDKPTGLDAMRARLNYWLAEENIWRVEMNDATNRYYEARGNVMRVKAEIAAAEAAAANRVVTLDDGEAT